MVLDVNFMTSNIKFLKFKFFFFLLLKVIINLKAPKNVENS
jgi:hypothetical protein